MPKPDDIDRVFSRVLDRATVHTGPQQLEGIFPVEATIRGRRLSMIAVWGGSGQLSEVREAIAAVPDPWPAHFVVVARELSVASRELIDSRDGSWADETGRARIATQDLVVQRDRGVPRQKQEFTWSSSSEAIGEALLAERWPSGIRTGDLARLTGWSLAQVSEILRSFDERGWTQKRGPQRGPGARRELVNADGLLVAWAPAVASDDRERRITHRTMQDPMAFLRETLSDELNEGVRWAATGWAAADVIAPLATLVPTLQIYVHEQDFYGPLSGVIEKAGLVEVPEGGSVEFIAADPDLLGLSAVRNDLFVASAPRVYADLLRIGGRAEDAAAHIREEVIRPLHQAFHVTAPSPELLAFEADSRSRLQHLVQDSERPDPYERGSWSASYRFESLPRVLPVGAFLQLLMTSVGDETGWPVWLIRHPEDVEIVDRVVERWMPKTMRSDPSHADFWRADSRGSMFLTRGYEEDGAIAGLQPGTTLDLTLPVWRVGEALLHAQRLGEALGATEVEFHTAWTGLAGRRLAAVVGEPRALQANRRSEHDTIDAAIRVPIATIDDKLPELVQSLVDPLYAEFQLFRPPPSFFREETEKMRTPIDTVRRGVGVVSR